MVKQSSTCLGLSNPLLMEHLAIMLLNLTNIKDSKAIAYITTINTFAIATSFIGTTYSSFAYTIITIAFSSYH